MNEVTAEGEPTAIDNAAARSYRLLIAEVYELAGRSRATSEGIARRHGQTTARWHVLSVLTDRPATVPGIARRLGLARQSVQRVAGDLIAAGWVQAVANPDHQRSPLLQLTARGRAQLQALTEDSAADRAARLAAAGLTAGQLDGARQVVRALIGALDG
jgi:DNA-binding MarR family transcriptional regulator